ncbi:MAG: hypothetical protein WA832_21990 [Bradyrhizobium sp.]
MLLRRPLADEVSDDDDPGRDPDAGLQDFATRRLKICDGVGQIKSSPHSPFGVVFVRARKSEISEHAVAHELCDKAVVACNHTSAGVLIGPNDLAHVLRVKASRHRRRSGKIAEQHRQLAALSSSLGRFRDWQPALSARNRGDKRSWGG